MNLYGIFSTCLVSGILLSACSPESKANNLVGPSLSPEAPTSAELTAEVIAMYDKMLLHSYVNELPEGYRIVALPVGGDTSSVDCQDPLFEDACVFRLARHDKITLVHEISHLNSATQARKVISGTPEKRLSCQGRLCFVKNELTEQEIILDFIEEGYVINRLTKLFDPELVKEYYNELNPKYNRYLEMYAVIIELAGKSLLDDNVETLDLFNTIYKGNVDENHIIAISRIAEAYQSGEINIEMFRSRIKDALFNPCPQGNLNNRYLEMAAGRRARQFI